MVEWSNAPVRSRGRGSVPGFESTSRLHFFIFLLCVQLWDDHSENEPEKCQLVELGRWLSAPSEGWQWSQCALIRAERNEGCGRRGLSSHLDWMVNACFEAIMERNGEKTEKEWCPKPHHEKEKESLKIETLFLRKTWFIWYNLSQIRIKIHRGWWQH